MSPQQYSGQPQHLQVAGCNGLSSRLLRGERDNGKEGETCVTTGGGGGERKRKGMRNLRDGRGRGKEKTERNEKLAWREGEGERENGKG